MTFRDDRDAQRARIEQLEEALAAAERERDDARAALVVTNAPSTEPQASSKDGMEAEARSDGEAVPAPTSFREGDEVHVDRHGTWWKATVRDVIEPDRLVVSYDDFSRRDLDTVERKRVIARKTRPPGPVGEPADPGGRFFMAFLLMVVLGVAAVLFLLALDHGLV